MASRDLILIHGAFSTPTHFAGWAAQFEAAGYRSHVPALPGHGDGRPVAGQTIASYRAALEDVLSRIEGPPVLIGHSMGGLLAQQLASAHGCAALVLVASAPPWALPAQPRALPRLLPLMPAILAGRPFRPSDATLCALALRDLPEADRARLLPGFVAESGKAYRELILGKAKLPGRRFGGPTLCVSGAEDRIVAAAVSREIARHYRAEHVVYRRRGHWLIEHAEVARHLLAWLAANT